MVIDAAIAGLVLLGIWSERERWLWALRRSTWPKLALLPPDPPKKRAAVLPEMRSGHTLSSTASYLSAIGREVYGPRNIDNPGYHRRVQQLIDDPIGFMGGEQGLLRMDPGRIKQEIEWRLLGDEYLRQSPLHPRYKSQGKILWCGEPLSSKKEERRDDL